MREIENNVQEIRKHERKVEGKINQEKGKREINSVVKIENSGRCNEDRKFG